MVAEKLNYVVQRPEQERQTRTKVRRHTIQKNSQKALPMDLPYAIVLCIAAICMLYICISYLQVHASISTRIQNIEQLELRLETLKSENDAMATRINTSIDLDYVYEVATQELGMVYANKEQVRLYDKTESEYVRQYEDIPN